MEKNIQEEKIYLKKTINKFNEIIETSNLRLEAIPRMYSDNIYLRNSLLNIEENRLRLVKRTKDKPYFARIDFTNEENIEQECYISKVGIIDDDNNLVTIDWRSPIATLYYDTNIGECSYNAPMGKISGKMTLKRQYEIENGDLLSYQDVDTVSNDDILKPYLGVSNNERLKNIVTTIQTEQNEIIRESLFENMIISGVAGSGKTTVALHRIAYLVYNNKNYINPEEYLVIGPNKFFVNYISSVLPDLDVNNVAELTISEILEDLLNKKITIIKDEESLIKYLENPESTYIEKYKGTLNILEKLDNYMNDYIETHFPQEDLIYKNYKLLDRDLIKKEFINSKKEIDKNDILNELLERTIFKLTNYVSINYSTIRNNIHKQYILKTSLNDIKIKEERNIILELDKYLDKNLKKMISDYFNPLKPNILKIYSQFLKNLNIENKNIEKGIISFSDIGCLLYMYYRFYGIKTYNKYRHTVIDESQDYNLLTFYALKKILNKSTFSIFGDMSQSIYEYRSINNFNEVANLFDDSKIKYLNKSYRTTIEIMNEANKINKYIKNNNAEAVIRHGKNVEYIKSNNIKDIESKIKELSNNYESIGIITKTNKETDEIYNELSKNIKINKINDNSLEYNGGITILTCMCAKGLEFDAVIIANADNIIYNDSKTIDMKLLYVSMTRPLHELVIFYNNILPKPLIEEI